MEKPEGERMNFWMGPKVNRRDFLVSVALGSMAGRVGASEGKGFRFIAANDLHYDKGVCRQWFTAMVEQMKRSAPDGVFCLLCGDLANTGERESLVAVKEIFGGLGMPVYPVPGNHDYGEKDGLRVGYDEEFPGRLNYRFEEAGWQFLGLDTTMGLKFSGTTIGEPTFEWLDGEMVKMDKEKPTICFTHFPLGEKVANRPVNADRLIERLLKLNIAGVLSGHWHGASEVPVGRGLMTTNRCCARVRGNHDRSLLKGWFVCEAKGDGTLERKFVEFKAPEGL